MARRFWEGGDVILGLLVVLGLLLGVCGVAWRGGAEAVTTTLDREHYDKGSQLFALGGLGEVAQRVYVTARDSAGG